MWFHCRDAAAKALWEALLSTKHKEAVMEVRRHLVEAASRENLPIKMSMGKRFLFSEGRSHRLQEVDWSLLWTAGQPSQHGFPRRAFKAFVNGWKSREGIWTHCPQGSAMTPPVLDSTLGTPGESLLTKTNSSSFFTRSGAVKIGLDLLPSILFHSSSSPNPPQLPYCGWRKGLLLVFN